MLAWVEPNTGTKRIIGGHTRKKAVAILQRRLPLCSPEQRAKWHPEAIRVAETGLVPCRMRTDLTRAQANELALADNKSNEWSPWDTDLLHDVLAELSADNLLDIGFSITADSDEFGIKDTRSKATSITKANNDASFTMTITGPLSAMQGTIEELRRNLKKHKGVQVDTSVTEF